MASRLRNVRLFDTRLAALMGDGENERLRSALASVPREVFIDPSLFARADEDLSLPIGYGQTISKPTTVVRMLSSLCLSPEERVLEVGVGSGYVLALLGKMGVCAYGIERFAPLARLARGRLDRLGLQDVLLKVGDGMKGWPEVGPFDAIVVSAAVDGIPNELLSQLSPKGRIVAPMNVDHLASQRLVLYRRVAASEYSTEDLGPCHFVSAT